MKVRIQTFPSLGEITTAAPGRQSICAVLEVPERLISLDWQVSLWLSIDGTGWSLLNLAPTDTEDGVVDLADRTSFRNLHFHGITTFTSSVQFTVKFRNGVNEPWIWANKEYGLKDGYIVSPTLEPASSKLDDLILDLNKEWAISSLKSQSPETQLWSLTAKISPGNDDMQGSKSIEIGTPFANFSKWFALVRTGIPWLAPRKGKATFSLDKDAILCSFANRTGRHMVFLAVSGVEDVSCFIRSSSSNSVFALARTDATVQRDMMILVSEGRDVDRAIAAAVYHARSLIWKYSQPSASQINNEDFGTVEPKWRENWYDGLGYCTWNSIGQDLSEDKILDALEKLRKSNITISNLIIDDNWQSIDTSDENSPSWLEFEANPAGFPKGLKNAVSQIKLKNGNIQHIFVWHALLGYWGGISPRGKIAQTYKTRQVPVVAEGAMMTVVDYDDISKYFDDFYSFLIQSGIDGVKTDAQCMLDTMTSASARRELTNAYLDKWSIASLRHFGTNAISCMSQFPQALFHAFMPQIRPPLVARNSDDYFPDVPSSHRWHVWANAHNSIFTEYLNIVPDWDMFQTVHAFADYHAAARCLSGGPIYITDVPGQHNVELLQQFTALTTLDKTIILRPSVVGKAMDPYQEYEAGSLLRIGSYHGSATGGISMLGVFQTSDSRDSSVIPLQDFRGVSRDRSYIVRAFTTGVVSKPLEFTETSTPKVLASPGPKGYEIYSAYELQQFDTENYGVISVASLGLVQKMAGAAAVIDSSIKRDSKITAVAKLKALGVAGVYISSLPDMAIEDNLMATIFGHPVPRHTVRVSATSPTVLEIDVQTAWKELGLDSGWSNEVEVTVNVLGI